MSSGQNGKKYLTTKELAERIGVSDKTIYNFIDEQKSVMKYILNIEERAIPLKPYLKLDFKRRYSKGLYVPKWKGI